MGFIIRNQGHANMRAGARPTVQRANDQIQSLEGREHCPDVTLPYEHES
jgi:hypothetical protein